MQDVRPAWEFDVEDVNEHLDRLHAQGFFILHRAVTDAQIQHIARELEPWLRRTPKCEGDFYGWNTTRIGGLLSKCPSSQSLLLHPFIFDIVQAVLGPYCDHIQLNLSQAVCIHPGERQQIPHRDDDMWPFPKGRSEWLVNVLWAIDDFTRDNGATLLWPRSHHLQGNRTLDEKDAFAATMPKGSALVFLGSLSHCGGANRSGADRTAIIFSYSLGWLRQYENQYLTYPPDVARQFPKAVRDLIGYRLHRPNIGVYEGRDPGLLLEGARYPLAMTDALPEAVAAELKAYYKDIG